MRELLQQALRDILRLADDLRKIPDDIAKTIQALEAELAKPEQKPVAVVDANDDGHWADILSDSDVKIGQLLYAAPPPKEGKQEPVAWLRNDGEMAILNKRRTMYANGEARFAIPLYTSPPRKEWVGLTDDEINDFDKKLRDNGDYCSLHFAWGISVMLKEKNNAS